MFYWSNPPLNPTSFFVCLSMGIEKLTTYPSHIQTPCLQPGLYESEWSRSLVFDHNTTTQHHEKGDTLKMQLVVQGFSKEYVIEVGEDDTTATMRQKVASAEGLCEDSFRMGFGGKDEGEDIRELSAGETITLTKSLKYEAISALHALGETDITAERLGQPDGGPPPIAHFCGARAYGISIFFSREPKSGQVLDKYVVLLDLQTVWGGGTSGRRVLPGTPISYHKELESCMECRVL